MAGHNKWSKVKHKKAASDAKKSQAFSKLVKLITAESKKAGGDTTAPSLKTAIDRAKAMSMPGDTIDRAVKKGLAADAASMDAITYETYGPGGTAIIIEALTDNRNKAAAEVKHILSKAGYTLAAQGSATWAFEHTADGWIPQNTVTLSETDTAKLEALVEQLEDNDEVQEVITNAEVLP